MKTTMTFFLLAIMLAMASCRTGKPAGQPVVNRDFPVAYWNGIDTLVFMINGIPDTCVFNTTAPADRSEPGGVWEIHDTIIDGVRFETSTKWE